MGVIWLSCISHDYKDIAKIQYSLVVWKKCFFSIQLLLTCKQMTDSITMSVNVINQDLYLFQVACELYPSRVVALCLDPYCGLGFALWVLSSVYSGHQSILIPPSEVRAFYY